MAQSHAAKKISGSKKCDPNIAENFSGEIEA
jgi:hypothetical protein